MCAVGVLNVVNVVFETRCYGCMGPLKNNLYSILSLNRIVYIRYIILFMEQNLINNSRLQHYILRIHI